MAVLMDLVLVPIGFAGIAFGCWCWIYAFFFRDETRSLMKDHVTRYDLTTVAAAVTSTLVGVIILTAKYITPA
jgi:hypothetical protein